MRRFHKKKIDTTYLIIIATILFFGLFMFASAALGVLARHEVKFYSVLTNQLLYALCGGVIALFIGIYINYLSTKKYTFYFYLITLILTVAVFIPHVGFSHGGSTRWIHLFDFSLQPSEFLKFGAVFFYAAWLSQNKSRLDDFAYGLIPFGLIAGIPFLLMLMQPDTGTGAIIVLSLFVMYIIAGATIRDIAIICFSGVIMLGALALVRPYIMDRIMTFIHPSHDATGSSYQLQQSLIAVGSGGVFGRGYGQSVQKFNFLPEPIGDSIFAVIGEELGFWGTCLVIIMFSAIAIRGMWIARRVPEDYGVFLVIGITYIYIVQACINIASMVGIFPLTGVPLPFISHGGTALLTALFGVGVVLNISKYRTL